PKKEEEKKEEVKIEEKKEETKPEEKKEEEKKEEVKTEEKKEEPKKEEEKKEEIKPTAEQIKSEEEKKEESKGVLLSDLINDEPSPSEPVKPEPSKEESKINEGEPNEKETLTKILDSDNSQLTDLKSKKKEEELTKDIPEFVLGRGGIKAVELLKEDLYAKIFKEPSPKHPDVLVVYKILLMFINKPTEKEILKISDDSQFWPKFCEYLQSDPSSANLGEFLNNKIKDFDFSDENIFNLRKYCLPIQDNLKPQHFSQLCNSTGLVFFIVKEALEYSGILVDKKTLAQRVYKNVLFSTQYIPKRLAQLGQ
ncbi:MAG: hypothetical protein MJ252_14345, partial [archaeon]|nr:hypothetical protein [archaeon]